MSVGPLTRRVIVSFEGDPSKLQKALKTIQVETGKATDDFVDFSRDASKALDTIGLGATAQVSKIDQLRNAFQGLTGKLGSGISAIDGFAKSLGPWNQALELGGKALGFASDALDAYAKRSPEAAKQVREVKDAFTELKDEAMAAAGWLTMDTLHGFAVGGRVGSDLAKIAGRITAKQTGLGSYYSSGDDETQDPMVALSGAYQGALKSFGPDAWSQINVGERAQALLDKAKKDFDKARDAAKQLAEERRKLANDVAKSLTDDLVKQLEGDGLSQTSFSDLPQMSGPSSSDLAASYQHLLEQNAKVSNQQYEASASRRNDSYLSTIFGPIEDFNAYGTAFDTLSGATTSAMQAWISGQYTLGQAIKKGLGDALGALASQLAVESLKHGAYAIGSLAFGDFSGAARHGAAAAAFGVGAVAAAAAAKKLGASVTADVAKDSGGASAGSSSSSGAGASSQGPGGGGVVNHYTIVYGEMFYQQSTRMRQHDASQFVQSALGTSYAEHS